MFLTTKVLEIAREAEAERLAKRPRGQPRKQPVIISDNKDEAEVLDDSSVALDNGIVVLVPRRRLLK
jgi:hypothetical protein